MTNKISFELRLVHHFICTMLIPKTEKYEHVTDKEQFFLWAYMTDSRIDLPIFVLDQMYKATMNKISLPYKMFLMKVFKYFKVDLSDEIKRVSKDINDEYNEKTLKRMGYELKDNKWTPKPEKKKEEESASEKAPSGSGNAKNSLAPKFEGFKMECVALWLRC